MPSRAVVYRDVPTQCGPHERSPRYDDLSEPKGTHSMEGQVRVKSVTIVDPTHAQELFIAGPNLVRPGNEVVMLTLCNMRSDVKHSGSERATSAELTRDDMVVEVVTRIVLPKSIA